MNFTGKIVVITGAGGIYGRQFAKAFARQGARLVLTDCKSAGLTALSRELNLSAERLHLHVADLADEAAIAAFIAGTEDAVGTPDIVVCNAGIYPFGGLLDTTGALWDDIMAINLKAPFMLTQGFAKLMIERGVKGSFVCIGSGAAHVLRTNGLAYCVSKRGLDWLVKGMALELAHWGIRVNAVEPGLRRRQRACAVSARLCREHGRAHSAAPHGRRGRGSQRRAVSLLGRGSLHHRRRHPGRWRLVDPAPRPLAPHQK